MIRSFWILTTLFALSGISGMAAGAQSTLMMDDFENGVGKWTRNDKTKTDNPSASVVLVDVLATTATRPTEPGGKKSEGAGLFTFKTAKASWASASLRISGAAWARVGARSLKFYINAGGDVPGVELMLRGSYRQPDGSTRDEVFQLPNDPQTKRPKPVRLDIKSWRDVSIPLQDFRDSKGRTALSRLNGLYLLQFVQRGTWDSRFFTIDDMRIVGTGKLIEQPTAAPVATATTKPASAATSDVPAGAIPVNIDFLRLQGRVRSSANVSIGAAWPAADGTVQFPLDDSAAFRGALQTLAPRFIRVDAGTLVELLDSSRLTFDFSRLQTAVSRIRSIKAEPLIALPNPGTWGLDSRGYGVFVGQAARALNTRNAKPVRYFELNTAGSTSATALYNSGYATLKKLSKNYRVGGIGATSGDVNSLNVLLRTATGLDFLSVKYFGAYSGTPEADSLMKTARDFPSLRTIAGALDRSKFRNAAIYVTQANLNAARAPEDVVPTDSRLVQIPSAAWWAAFLSNGSRLSDQIFFNDATNPEWGLLNERASAYPAYYALWMWNTFFPPGSQRVQATTTSTDIDVFACNTPTAHNVLMTNMTPQNVTTHLTIRGFPVLRAARMRSIQDPLDPRTGVRFQDLPKSPFQTITLAPYSIAVLQFIEPPKAKR